MPCAKKRTTNPKRQKWEKEVEKKQHFNKKKPKEKSQLLGTKWEKHPAPRAVAAALLRSASVQGVSVTFAVRFVSSS